MNASGAPVRGGGGGLSKPARDLQGPPPSSGSRCPCGSDATESPSSGPTATRRPRELRREPARRTFGAGSRQVALRPNLERLPLPAGAPGGRIGPGNASGPRPSDAGPGTPGPSKGRIPGRSRTSRTLPPARRPGSPPGSGSRPSVRGRRPDAWTQRRNPAACRPGEAPRHGLRTRYGRPATRAVGDKAGLPPMRPGRVPMPGAGGCLKPRGGRLPRGFQDPGKENRGPMSGKAAFAPDAPRPKKARRGGLSEVSNRL